MTDAAPRPRVDPTGRSGENFRSVTWVSVFAGSLREFKESSRLTKVLGTLLITAGVAPVTRGNG